MRGVPTLAALLAIMSGAAAAQQAATFPAPTPTSERSPRARETEAILRDYMGMVYDRAELYAAKAKYLTPDFIQHNPEIASGTDGDKHFIAAREKRDPARFRPVSEWVNKIDHIMVDDKYMVVHHRLYTNPDDRGRVFVDISRVENGKIVEHWDIIQPIPAAAKNGNGMGGDLVPGRRPEAGEPDPEMVIRDYLRIGLEQKDAAGAAEKYVADNFRQHSPHIADGKAALIAYFREKAKAPGAADRFSRVSHILADGDLVLVTRHSGAGPQDRGSIYADLFRVQGGKIVEHWDVIQEIPETSINGNTMW